MDNLIQQLKDNEKPFGLMSEEMQVKAAAMGLLDNFQLFVGPGWGGVFKATGCRFCTGKVYRLRPDYEEEPEIVECEIRCNDSVGKFYFDGLNMCPLSQVFNQPDFIGFKFEDGTWYDHRIKPVSKGSSAPIHNIDTDDIISGRVEVIHATHILFRRPK